MPIEYIDNQFEAPDRDPIEMTVGDVQLRGIVEVEESGAGFHEEYKAERERESGGEVSKSDVSEPPAAEVTVTAWGKPEDWERLNELRKQRSPFPVSIGPVAYAQMGIKNLEAQEIGTHPEAKEITIKLKEFREVVVQRQSVEEALGGGQGGSAAPGAPSGPSGWGPNEGPSVSGDTVAAGATKTYQVASGESWGRRVVDQSASGANAHVATSGGGWTVQDVGFNGVFNGRNLDEGDTLIHAKTPNGNGALIKHIYMGDGSSKARDTGIFFNANSQGDLTVTEINAQGWRDNAMYLSAPHESGSGGPSIEISDSFAYNNETSSYRMGRGVIRNCVGEHDGSHSGRGNRTVWARPPGQVRLEECDFANSSGHAIVAGAQSKPSTVNLSNTRVSGNIKTDYGSTVNGSSAGSANTSNYSGNVPGGPRQAASGAGHSSSDGSDSAGGSVE